MEIPNLDACDVRVRTTQRRPLFHPSRICSRDDKLWNREMQAAQVSADHKMFCPCMECKGNYKTTRKTARGHLLRHGRYPACRVWEGDGADSSDEEWAEDYVKQFGPQALRYASQEKAALREQPLTDVELEVRGLVMESIECAAVDELNFVDIGDEPFDLDDALGGGKNEAYPDNTADADCGEPNGQAERGTSSKDRRSSTIEDSMQPLFEGSKTDVLSFVLLFLNTCHNHGFTNAGVNELLALMAEHVMPKNHRLPHNLYGAKQLLRDVGMDYERIPACEKGCILFRGAEYAKLDACPKCQRPKLKKVGNSMQPVKVLRYFPITPRLKRMYATRATSELMTWHHDNKSTDGMVRHPADSKAWKHVDTNVDAEFAEEPRNVRFGLALDGVNPFGNNSTAWSTWPILLLNYNVPPWLTSKKFFVMLALLIPGPETVSEQNLDIYLEPLLEELVQLWKGVDCFDVLPRPRMSQSFQLRAMIMWTVNDYPGYGLISGQQHQGYKACVVCGPNCVARGSKKMNKLEFGGARRWLPSSHLFRKKENAKFFDGSVETCNPPPRMASSNRQRWGTDAAEYMMQPGNKFEDEACPTKEHGVKRASGLYKLPYWHVSYFPDPPFMA